MTLPADQSNASAFSRQHRTIKVEVPAAERLRNSSRETFVPFGGRTSLRDDRLEPVGAHTSVGWHRRQTTTAAPAAISMATVAVTGRNGADDDNLMTDVAELDAMTFPSRLPLSSTSSSSVPRPANRLQTLSSGLAALRTTRSPAGSSLASSSFDMSTKNDEHDVASTISPFFLTPGLHEPGTQGRERTAGSMGLLPSPPSQSQATAGQGKGLMSSAALWSCPAEERALQSPIRRRRAAVDMALSGQQRDQRQEVSHLQMDSLLSCSLPTTRRTSVYGDTVPDQSGLDHRKASGLRSVSPASRLSLRQKPNGQFIVDYVGPQDEPP